MVSRGLRATVRVAVGALDLDVDLAVEPGTTVAVLGPNGAGKTSLLRALAGLLPIDAGSIVLDGEVLEDTGTGVFVPPERRAVGLVFQDHLLFPHLSALENVAFGLRSRGVPRAEARAAAGAWLDRVGLAGRGSDRPASFSGGEAQRVALARALATAPRLLLLDEPLSALDATTRLATRRDLATFLRGHDGVRLLVTHDPLEAIALADRLIVLEEGRVVQEGSAASLTAQPRSAYVADLVGVNLLEGEATATGVVVAGAPDIHLAVVDGVRGPVLAVVHPRSVSLHRSVPEGSPRNVWRGQAVSVDLEGERARVRVALDSTGPSPPILVAEVTVGAVTDLHLAEGGQVWASAKATEVAVYPR